MKKSSKTKEISRLIKAAKAWENKALLDFETAIFLAKESSKLQEIIDNPNTSPEEKEEAMVKQIALDKRMLIEINDKSNEKAKEQFEKELTAFIKGLQ